VVRGPSRLPTSPTAVRCGVVWDIATGAVSMLHHLNIGRDRDMRDTAVAQSSVNRQVQRRFEVRLVHDPGVVDGHIHEQLVEALRPAVSRCAPGRETSSR
jgi:predicted glycoside hydrolase/deacetylase ChbG (UPF0249 family)